VRSGDARRLVLVDWVDSCRSSSWEPLETISAMPLHCQSVGWLVKQTREGTVIVPHRSQEPPSQGCGTMVIPTAAIVRIVDLVDVNRVRGAEARAQRAKRASTVCRG
jgi:hypothetical protein